MFEWAQFDAAGAETGTSETFASQAETEAWFGTAWQAMGDAGITDVALRDTTDGTEIYRMSLAAE